MALESGTPLLSHADYLTLPDEPRGEVLEGVFVVTPAPTTRHQRVVGDLYFAFETWLRANPGVGEAFVAPLDVILRAERPAVVLQPDVVFVSAARAGIVQDWIHGAPDLVVEVVSPSSARRDAISKRDLYARYGIREFWLVWPTERRVDVLTFGEGGKAGPVRTLEAEDRLDTPLMPGLAIPLAGLWGPPEPGT